MTSTGAKKAGTHSPDVCSSAAKLFLFKLYHFTYEDFFTLLKLCTLQKRRIYLDT